MLAPGEVCECVSVRELRFPPRHVMGWRARYFHTFRFTQEGTPGTWLLLWWSSLFHSLCSAVSVASISRRGEGASTTPKRDDVTCEACVCLEPQALVVFRGDQEQGTRTCLSHLAAFRCLSPIPKASGGRKKERKGRRSKATSAHVSI